MDYVIVLATATMVALYVLICWPLSAKELA
jgi:hypothetical protein